MGGLRGYARSIPRTIRRRESGLLKERSFLYGDIWYLCKQHVEIFAGYDVHGKLSRPFLEQFFGKWRA